MAKKKSTFSLGTDPEFLLTSSVDGTPVPAWDLTLGTKEDHQHISVGVEIHADNVALELTTIPSYDDAYHFYKNSITAYQYLKKYCAPFGLNVLTTAYTDKFSENQLRHPMAQRLGCNPDFDAYSAEPKLPRQAPMLEAFNNYRFFGGHIHLGYDRSLCPTHVMAQLLDLFVGLRSLAYDKQGPRRKIYGQAGLYRPKLYGVEYRTLSNFWLAAAPAACRCVAINAAACAMMVNSHRDETINLYKKTDWPKVRELINAEAVDEGYELFKNAANIMSITTGISFE